MRKKQFIVATVVALSASMMMQSCIGSFALFNKVKDWNDHVGSKFVNEVVFVAMWILPVYELCFAADLFILNSIEFWSGTNPMEANIGTTKNVMGSDGVLYAVTTLKNGYEIKAPTGEITHFWYDAKTKTWSFEQGGISHDVFTFNDDGTIAVYLHDGQQLNVMPDMAGPGQGRMAGNGGNYFAMY